MSDREKARILFLDPDSDFLDSMKQFSEKREVGVEYLVFGREERKNIIEIVLEKIPDIIVLHLDHDSEENFGECVREISQIPISPTPLICGITDVDNRLLLKQVFEAGLDDYHVRPVDPAALWLKLDVWVKIRKLQVDYDSAARRLSSLNSKLSKANIRLEELTVTDELTGLHNMRYMTQSLAKHFSLLKRYERPFSMLMLDLDKFKQVNDKNDHLAGSQAIQEIGSVIEACTRDTDIKARYGGDEYIVAMPETDRVQSKVVGERLLSAIAAHKIVLEDGTELSITASIGIATFDNTRHALYTDLIKDADRAMYKAKESGRNQVCFHDDEDVEGYDESQSSIIAAVKKIKAS